MFELETELSVNIKEQPIYVIYPDEAGGNWRVQAVPVSPESFESRKALPEVWRGIRDDELSKLSGIEGCIFVHASGFIGGMFKNKPIASVYLISNLVHFLTGNATKEGALKMAKVGLEL